MAWEDFWYYIVEEVKELKVQKQFDAQLKKMSQQDKHRYKDTREKWEYALTQVKKNLKKKKKK